jgi:GNAT superfamily N-acetyltransferase
VFAQSLDHRGSKRVEDAPVILPFDVDSLILDYGHRQYSFHAGDERHLAQWSASIELTDDNGDVEHRIGRILAYTVEYESMADPFSELDAETADLSDIAAAVFDSTGDLDANLDDLVEPFGSGMLVIDTVRLEPDWRGYGLGPLCAGLMIERLAAGRRLVVLRAAPAERRTAEGEVVEEISAAERDIAVGKLGRLWSQLGFEHFKDEVWVLDPALVTFAKAMDRVRARVGLPR